MASWAAASHEGYRQVEDGYRADRSARLPAPAPGSLPGRTAATVVLPAQRLEAKVDAFRTRKETIKAAYTAAEAETHVGEAVSGISEEMGDIGMAMQRAQP